MLSSCINNNEEKKNTIRLFGINSLICGVEIAASCYFAFIPPMLLKAGFSNSTMTITLGIAPIANLLTAPTLAKWSDGCSSKFGRRKPFILVISTIMTFSILLIPISSFFINNKSIDLRTNIFLLSLGVILFSYSYQAIFNPCQALLVDLSLSKRSRGLDGFRIYSTCMFLGCIVGYLVASIEWKLSREDVLSKEELSFFIVAVMFNVCLIISLSVAKEKPYVVSGCDGAQPMECNPSNEKWSKKRLSSESIAESVDLQEADVCLFSSQRVRRAKVSLQNVIGSFFSSVLRIIMLPLRCYQHIKLSPTVIQKLFVTELFGWTACLCHNMFFTVFVSEHFFKGEPGAAQHSREADLYDEGVQAGSWGLFLQSLTACIYALFLQHHLVSAAGCKIIFLAELSLFASCMAATVLSPSMRFLHAVTALSGIGSAALTTFPGMLISLYNEDPKLYLWDARNNNSPVVGIELGGVGANVAVLDMAFFLSQIILALVVGPLVDIGGSPLLYMIFACGAGIFAVIYGSKVVCSPVDLSMVRNYHQQVLVV